MVKKKKLSKVDRLVKKYSEAVRQEDIQALAALTRNPELKKSSLYPALKTILEDRHLDKDNVQATFNYPNNPATAQINSLVNSWKADNSKTPSAKSQIGNLMASVAAFMPNVKTQRAMNRLQQKRTPINYLASDIAGVDDRVYELINLTKQVADEKAKSNANAATIASLNAKIADLEKKIPKTVLQTIGAHPFTHAGAFALGYGARGFKDRWDRRVKKKGLDSDTNITGGLFNFGKAKNTEIKYLNKRLNKNILSKFMTFDSNDDRVLNTNHPIFRKDPQLLKMIQDLIASTRQEGRYFTSDRDLANLRKQINQVEHYMLNKYPNLMYSNGNNGETNDLKNYLSRFNKDKQINYVGDMAKALNDERIEVDKQLEPSKWRKRLQKWLA